MENRDSLELQIAEQLRRQRLARLWSREELAKRAGINVYTLKHFERTGQVSLPRLLKICEALDMLTDVLRAFKPRARVNVDGWAVSNQGRQRQRGRRVDRALPIDS